MLLAALIFVDDTDFNMLNFGPCNAEELVVKEQQLLDAWNEILKFTGRDLKLSKYYQTLKDYK